MTLTPEDRQRIYEEEKARREAQERIDQELKAKKSAGTLKLLGGLLVVLFVVLVAGALTTGTQHQASPDTASAPTSGAAMDKAEVLSDIGVTTTALKDMQISVAGESMDAIKLTLETFSAAATLIQTAQAESLSDEERQQVATLRRTLVLRQREAFPLIRNHAGPLMSRELWASDGKARTFGTRFTTIEFVNGSFAAHANIATAHQAIVGLLTRMRFKRDQYKWFDDADESSYYSIVSPRDGDVAIIDTEGNVTDVPVQ